MAFVQNELPAWHFDEDFLVFKDGSVGRAYEVLGKDVLCSESEVINIFSKNIEKFLLTASEDIKLQIFYDLDWNVSSKVDGHKNLGEKVSGPYSNVFAQRLSNLNDNVYEKNFYKQKIYVFVRSGSVNLKKKNFFDKASDFSQVTRSEYNNHKESFNRSCDQIKMSLSACGLNPKVLSSNEWFRLLFKYLNLDRYETHGTPIIKGMDDLFAEPLSSQLCLTDMSFNMDGVKIGKYTFKAITLKNLPEGQTYASMVNGFTKMSFHFFLSQNIHMLDQSKERASLQLKRRIAHSMASGSKNVSDLDSENKLYNIESLLSELLEGSTKLLSQSFTVIIWGETEKELRQKSDEVLRAYRDLNQAEGLVETLTSKDVFFKNMPGSCEGLRHKKMKSSNIAHLMPVYAQWEGNKRPVCLLPNRDSGLFALDPFNKELPNWNGIVFGGSGSGKSFSVAALMLQFYGQVPNPRIIWIDNGASSKTLIDVLDGEFLDLKLDSGMCINMFDLSKDEYKPTAQKVKLILAVLELILKDEDKLGLPKRQKALLEEAIFKVYKLSKNKTPTLSDLRKLLSSHEVKEMRDFSEILYSWTGDRAYGKLLDGQTNVKLSKDLISIEVQSLSQHQELKDVILLLLTSYIQETSSKDFDRPYLLLVDEAERLFQTELAKQFVITCYRTWRKFNSGIWCLSQNYKDFMQDKNLRDSLMPNTTSVIILRQRKIDWKDFKETFDFNDAQVEVIKSLEIVKGKYSEFFYLQDENQTVLRLVPDPLTYWICTSDGLDKSKIIKTMEENKGLSKMNALLYLSGLKSLDELTNKNKEE